MGFGLGWSVVWDRVHHAARPLELYGGLEAEWTMGVWVKGIVRLLNLSALPKIKVIVVPRRQLCLVVVTLLVGCMVWAVISHAEISVHGRVGAFCFFS